MEEKKDILDHLKVNRIALPSDSYFEDLASEVIKSASRKRNKSRIIYLSITAAAITILALLFIMPSTDTIRRRSGIVSFAELDEKEIKEFIKEQEDTFHSNDLVQGSETDTIRKPAQGMTTEKLGKAFSELSDEEILEFLNEQGLDPEEAEEEEEIMIF